MRWAREGVVGAAAALGIRPRLRPCARAGARRRVAHPGTRRCSASPRTIARIREALVARQRIAAGAGPADRAVQCAARRRCSAWRAGCSWRRTAPAIARFRSIQEFLAQVLGVRRTTVNLDHSHARRDRRDPLPPRTHRDDRPPRARPPELRLLTGHPSADRGADRRAGRVRRSRPGHSERRMKQYARHGAGRLHDRVNVVQI